jgi:hypothetical protein
LFAYIQIKSINKIVILIFEIKDRNLLINVKILSFPLTYVLLAHPMWIALIHWKKYILSLQNFETKNNFLACKISFAITTTKKDLLINSSY